MQILANVNTGTIGRVRPGRRDAMCRFDSTSVKLVGRTPGGAARIIPSLRSVAGGSGCVTESSLCQTQSVTALSHIRLTPRGVLGAGVVEFQISPVGFREAVARPRASGARISAVQVIHRLSAGSPNNADVSRAEPSKVAQRVLSKGNPQDSF